MTIVRSLWSLLCVFIFSSLSPAQTGWYVHQSGGSNSNIGTSPAAAFKTVDKAVSVVQPGDTIYVMGEYTNASYNPSYQYTDNINDPHIWTQENSFRVNGLHGAPGQYITFKPYDGNTILKGDGANIVRFTNCSYIRFEGFEIQGEVDNIPLSTALALQFLFIDDMGNVVYRVPPGTTDAEIESMTFSVLGSVTRPSYTDTRGLYFSNVDHVDIIGNIIHHTPGNGLRVAVCDYVNIIGNEVHNTSRKSYSGTHGLVVASAASIDGNNGHKIFITHNLVHHNYNEIYSWSPQKDIITPHIDEGKGISLQRNMPADGWVNGRFLVANNITYWNGYSGVHANEGARMDFINNTSYKNYYTAQYTYNDLTKSGQFGITAQDCESIRMVNNISYTGPGIKKAFGAGNTSNLEVSNNVVYGDLDLEVDAVDQNSIFADPEFVDPDNFNFNLQDTSPAINAGSASDAPSDDFAGVDRDAAPDIGALENTTALPVEWLYFNALATTAGVQLAWATASEINNDYFTLERSADGQSWELLAQVKGKGNTLELSVYEFWDKNPLQGLNYYRLKQVDFDGKFEFAPIQVVFWRPEQFALAVYPTITSTVLYLPSTQNNTFLRVFDAQGRDVTSLVSRKSDTEMNVSNLRPGCYIVKTNSGVGRFVKK